MRRLCVGSVRVKIGRGRQGEERLPIKQHQHFEERVGGKKELNMYIYKKNKKTPHKPLFGDGQKIMVEIKTRGESARLSENQVKIIKKLKQKKKKGAT